MTSCYWRPLITLSQWTDIIYDVTQSLNTRKHRSVTIVLHRQTDRRGQTQQKRDRTMYGRLKTGHKIRRQLRGKNSTAAWLVSGRAPRWSRRAAAAGIIVAPPPLKINIRTARRRRRRRSFTSAPPVFGQNVGSDWLSRFISRCTAFFRTTARDHQPVKIVIRLLCHGTKGKTRLPATIRHFQFHSRTWNSAVSRIAVSE